MGLPFAGAEERRPQVRDRYPLKLGEDAKLPFKAVDLHALGLVLQLQDSKLFRQLTQPLALVARRMTILAIWFGLPRGDFAHGVVSFLDGTNVKK